MKNTINILVLLIAFLLTIACAEKSAQSTSVEAEEKLSKSLGQEVYENTCIACHAQAINGAPILGNKKMWAKRIGQGEETLINHAINGFSLMPAKGGNVSLSDEDVAAAVHYMIDSVK